MIGLTRNTKPTGPEAPTREAVLRAAEAIARSCGWSNRLAMRTAVLRERALDRLPPRAAP